STTDLRACRGGRRWGRTTSPGWLRQRQPEEQSVRIAHPTGTHVRRQGNRRGAVPDSAAVGANHVDHGREVLNRHREDRTTRILYAMPYWCPIGPAEFLEVDRELAARERPPCDAHRGERLVAEERMDSLHRCGRQGVSRHRQAETEGPVVEVHRLPEVCH